MHLFTKRLARAAAIAAAIVSSSGSLPTGRPLFATLGDVAFGLTAGFSEVEEVRRKINRRPRAETCSAEGIGGFFVVKAVNDRSPIFVC